MNHSVLHTVALIACAGALFLYVIGLVVAFRRVAQQYSSAMPGVRGLRTAATVASAVKLWPILTIAIAGGVLLFFTK